MSETGTAETEVRADTEAVPAAAQRPAASGWSLRGHHVVGSLLALATVGIAQPLLDLIGRNATFLVAHGASRLDVIILALALPIGLPALIALVVLGLRRVSPAVAAGLHAVLLGVLGGVLALVVLRLGGASDSLPWTASVAVAAAAGGLVAATYRLSATFRRVLTMAAIAAPVVTAMFLLLTPARAIAFPPPPTPSSVAGIGGDSPPIVFIVFDELPVASLLDADGQIDADAWPAFARLAQDSTFYRNATTVHGQTSDAVPAALDGRYPRADALPIVADHPENLLALLPPTYDLHVAEALTQLCPVEHCSRSAGAPAASRYRTLARDLAVVGSHLVLPPELATGLPAIDQGWRDFGGQAETLGGKERAMHERFHAERAQHPSADFDRFVEGVQANEDPTLHFVHVLLPHSPWQYLPGGQEYLEEWDWPALVRGRWIADEWRVAQTQQRHFIQTQLVDRMLGRLLDRLDETGIYDEAVVVLMADHGASFTPETSLRVIARETFGEIAAVPLFIKHPEQAGGDVSDLPVETVDIMPSVLDAIGGEVPTEIDGRSVFDADAPQRTTKTFFGPAGPLEFPADGREKDAAVARKWRWHGRSEAFGFPYGIAPPGTEDLLGQPVPERSAAEIGHLSVQVHQPETYEAVDLQADKVPAAYLKATISGPLHTRPAVAIGVNGVIAAVTLVEEEPSAAPFRAMLPLSALRDGANDLSFWLVQSYGLVELATADGG